MNNPTDVDSKRNEEIIKNAGCDTIKEYKNKTAQKRGFKDNADATRLQYQYYRRIKNDYRLKTIMG